MLRKFYFPAAGLALAAGALVYIAGCNNSQNGADQAGESAKGPEAKRAADQKGPSDKKADEHPHKPGAHGGIIVEIGRDNYHAEAVFEKGGLLKLYTLGKDEAKVIDVESQELKAYVKEEGAAEATEVTLNSVPRPGDKAGRTSQFIGKLPAELAGKQLVVTIPSITINGERFRVGFASATADHDAGMPSGVSAAEEKNLYLKPGGIYTEADIKANGNVTASQKFKGLKAKHDLRPKPGDKICPITLTKANPQFSWIVNGRTYEFCCPPCVDEFVLTAKTKPDEIKEPQEYVKQK